MEHLVLQLCRSLWFILEEVRNVFRASILEEAAQSCGRSEIFKIKHPARSETRCFLVNSHSNEVR